MVPWCARLRIVSRWGGERLIFASARYPLVVLRAHSGVYSMSYAPVPTPSVGFPSRYISYAVYMLVIG